VVETWTDAIEAWNRLPRRFKLLAAGTFAVACAGVTVAVVGPAPLCKGVVAAGKSIAAASSALIAAGCAAITATITVLQTLVQQIQHGLKLMAANKNQKFIKLFEVFRRSLDRFLPRVNSSITDGCKWIINVLEALVIRVGSLEASVKALARTATTVGDALTALKILIGLIQSSLARLDLDSVPIKCDNRDID
jgi:hypothetical protein